MMLPVWTEIEDDAGAIDGNTNRHLQSCEPEHWGFDLTGQPSVPDRNGPIRHLQQAIHARTDHRLPRAGGAAGASEGVNESSRPCMAIKSPVVQAIYPIACFNS